MEGNSKLREKQIYDDNIKLECCRSVFSDTLLPSIQVVLTCVSETVSAYTFQLMQIWQHLYALQKCVYHIEAGIYFCNSLF